MHFDTEFDTIDPFEMLDNFKKPAYLNIEINMEDEQVEVDHQNKMKDVEENLKKARAKKSLE